MMLPEELGRLTRTLHRLRSSTDDREDVGRGRGSDSEGRRLF